MTDYQKKYDGLYDKVNVSFADGYGFINDYQDGNFIIAFYKAARKTDILEPKNPTKPVLSANGIWVLILRPNYLTFFLI